jgi:DNA-directed RNA polymerase subunit RPC12/RpoP
MPVESKQGGKMPDEGQTELLTCTQCGQVEHMTATYRCMHCDTHHPQGPEPDGIPSKAPCPGCGQEMVATETRCLHCSESGGGENPVG